MDKIGVDMVTRVLELGEFPASELFQLSTLNSVWKEACESSTLWQNLYLEVPKYSECGLNSIAKRCSSLKELTIGKDPRHPRALSLQYCCSWLDGLESILTASRRSLRKVVVAPGCNMYKKDYRSGPFYRQLMRLVSRYCRRLSECEIYYSSGKCGLEKEIVKWFQPFVNSCPDIKSFVFFTPGQDYGSLENTMIRTMAKTWEKLESLEVSGEDITLEGIKYLRHCKFLTKLTIRYATFGLWTRPRELNLSQGTSVLTQGTFTLRDSFAPLRKLELFDAKCEASDFLILLRLFPSLEEISVSFSGDFGNPDGDIDPELFGQGENFSGKSMAELQFDCSQDSILKTFVSFHSV